MNLQELAEQYADTLVPVSPPRKDGAILGYIKGAELALGFAERLLKEGAQADTRGWRYKGVHPFTSSELFKFYLNTLPHD